MQLSNLLQIKAKQNLHLQKWESICDEAHKFTLPHKGKDLVMICAWHESKGGESLLLATRGELTLIERAYLEAFCELASTLSWTKLSLLGSRELENYLRDDNHTPAHEFDEGLDIGRWLDILRDRILIPWLASRLSSHKLEAGSSSSALELAQWLNHIDGKLWGARAPQAILSSKAANLVPLESVNHYEVQWRFMAEIEPSLAQSLCLVIENAILARGMTVKVVAES